jgi:NAD(P)-dependent dehydrogenase (short-subunit alcohol dehydrogenase family)
MCRIINFKGKTIIVTGAGSGIGSETAVILSQQGARVVVLDLNEEGLNKTLAAMTGLGHIIRICDLTNFDALPALVKDIVKMTGAVDGFVHCAGVSSRKPLNVLKAKGFQKVMDVNFYSFVELARILSKKEYMNDGGSIVVVSSISSIRGYKAKSEYCVSKAAVDAFVRCVALEFADRRIRVNSVMPAEVLTPLAQKAREINEAIGAPNFNAPLGPSEPYEVANTIAFLLSDATKTITGSSILIDGGATI